MGVRWSSSSSSVYTAFEKHRAGGALALEGFALQGFALEFFALKALLRGRDERTGERSASYPVSYLSLAAADDFC